MEKDLTQIMKKEHEKIDDVFDILRDSKRKDSLKDLYNSLIGHFKREEKIMDLAFDKKEEISPLPIAQSLRLEHKKITKILKNIKGNTREIDPKSLNELFLALRHHKNVEERLFYPKLDRLLTKNQKGYILQNISPVGG